MMLLPRRTNSSMLFLASLMLSLPSSCEGVFGHPAETALQIRMLLGKEDFSLDGDQVASTLPRSSSPPSSPSALGRQAPQLSFVRQRQRRRSSKNHYNHQESENILGRFLGLDRTEATARSSSLWLSDEEIQFQLVARRISRSNSRHEARPVPSRSSYDFPNIKTTDQDEEQTLNSAAADVTFLMTDTSVGFMSAF